MPYICRRAYDDPAKTDGFRVLVDRLWPRGRSKETLRLDAWMRDLAPSTELRKWFHGNLAQRSEFKRRYFRELDAQAELVRELKQQGKAGVVTLVYAGKDTEFNNATVLKEYLERR
jgi:uncharacterized protein YeaO (DUF488 family)